MNIITIGIDLAKNIFAVHGVNESGKPELVKPKVPRDQLLSLIANLPPCLLARWWAKETWLREFTILNANFKHLKKPIH